MMGSGEGRGRMARGEAEGTFVKKNMHLRDMKQTLINHRESFLSIETKYVIVMGL